MLAVEIIFLLIFLLAKSEAKEISCEKIELNYVNQYGIKSPKTCLMSSASTVDSLGFLIASPRDETVEVLRMSTNKKIFFLPENVAEMFPNLVSYYAYGCSLTEVSKKNFRSLRKLTLLSLNGNNIEEIASNTFEDLRSLLYLYLREEFRRTLIFILLTFRHLADFQKCSAIEIFDLKVS